MNPMKLYKLLQQHVGEMNTLVMGLYNENIEPETAQIEAIAKLKKILAALEEK
jgi:hypothetical protein